MQDGAVGAKLIAEDANALLAFKRPPLTQLESALPLPGSRGGCPGRLFSQQ